MITDFDLIFYCIFTNEITNDDIIIRTRKRRTMYYNQKKTYREIAKEARISPRDIGMILNKASRESESKHSMSVASQAYKMLQLQAYIYTRHIMVIIVHR
jgi:K+/H+ antiporter YhaU regulatory subunit KhtT